MTTHSLSHPFARTGGQGWLATIRAALALRAQRNSLKKLDDRALADMGISRAAAQREARRALWDVPTNWVRSHSR